MAADCKVTPCRNCKQEGHLTKDCKESRSCNLCREAGHVYKACPRLVGHHIRSDGWKRQYRVQRRHTWLRPDGSIRSRIDFLNVSHTFSVGSTDIKPMFFSDHCLLLADCHLQDNQHAKGKTEGTKLSKLQRSMQNLLMLQTMGVDVKEDLQEVKSQEVLENSTWEKLDQPSPLDELTNVLESLEKNKTPRSNSLLDELYSALWDLIGQDLLEIYNMHKPMSICDQFKLASGAKVNQGKTEAMFFGNWADRSFIPFTIRTDYLKVPRKQFGGSGMCEKSWEERITKVRQKLGFWEHHFLSIVGKTFIIRKWLACSVLKTLREKEREDPIKELTLTKCCRLAHSKVKNNVLRDAPKAWVVGYELLTAKVLIQAFSRCHALVDPSVLGLSFTFGHWELNEKPGASPDEASISLIAYRAVKIQPHYHGSGITCRPDQ
eukprot:g42612.t1